LHDEGTSVPAPVDQMPVERAPYDPGPPVNVEATPQPEAPPPPPPVPVIEAPPEKPKRGWWRR